MQEKLKYKYEKQKKENKKPILCLTKLLSSSGTPGTFVDRRSLVLVGDKENLIVSPKLIT